MQEYPNALLKRSKAELQAEAETLHAALNIPGEGRNRLADMDKSQLIQVVCVMKAIQEGRVSTQPVTMPASATLAPTDAPAWLGTLLASMDKRAADADKRAADQEKRMVARINALRPTTAAGTA